MLLLRHKASLRINPSLGIRSDRSRESVAVCAGRIRCAPAVRSGQGKQTARPGYVEARLARVDRAAAVYGAELLGGGLELFIRGGSCQDKVRARRRAKLYRLSLGRRAEPPFLNLCIASCLDTVPHHPRLSVCRFRHHPA